MYDSRNPGNLRFPRTCDRVAYEREALKPLPLGKESLNELQLIKGRSVRGNRRFPGVSWKCIQRTFHPLAI